MFLCLSLCYCCVSLWFMLLHFDFYTSIHNFVLSWYVCCFIIYNQCMCAASCALPELETIKLYKTNTQFYEESHGKSWRRIRRQVSGNDWQRKGNPKFGPQFLVLPATVLEFPMTVLIILQDSDFSIFVHVYFSGQYIYTEMCHLYSCLWYAIDQPIN